MGKRVFNKKGLNKKDKYRNAFKGCDFLLKNSPEKKEVSSKMERFLVYEKTINGPATHAIVIGVGDYPHLVGGTKRLSKWNDSMGQLSSPPISARAFSDWLISAYNNPQRPLATVALLVSANTDLDYTPPGGRKVSPERVTMQNVDEAVISWKRRGDTNADNLLIFYFCGHGALAGTETSLLLEDFGADDDRPLRGAIDFRQFRLGMDKCRARQQIYFIDACRVASSAVLDSAGNYAGEPILTGSLRPVPGGPARQAPVFNSTLAGTSAYARENQVSLFTEALLRALAGAADDADADEKWRVKTTNLSQGINDLLMRAAEKGVAIHQTNSTDELAVFTLHELTGDPLVPVFVGCEPQQANRECELSYTSVALSRKLGPGDASGWDLDLTPGPYTFVAESLTDPSRRGERQREIRPPSRRVRVEVVP
jgi:hypothetical protein